MSFMDAVAGARERGKTPPDGQRPIEDRDIETFIITRSELFGTKAILEEEARLTKEKAK